MKKFRSLVFVSVFIFLLSGCANTANKGNKDKKGIPDTTSSVMQKSSESITDNTNQNEEITNNVEDNDIIGEFVFNTDNINRITFYSYYGKGTGSDVTAENMEEIKKWLGTFTIDKKLDEIIDPGTNYNEVEIEYMDGTIYKTGLDVIGIEGTSYYVKCGTQPECFMEILSKTSYK